MEPTTKHVPTLPYFAPIYNLTELRVDDLVFAYAYPDGIASPAFIPIGRLARIDTIIDACIIDPFQDSTTQLLIGEFAPIEIDPRDEDAPLANRQLVLVYPNPHVRHTVSVHRYFVLRGVIVNDNQ